MYPTIFWSNVQRQKSNDLFMSEKKQLSHQRAVEQKIQAYKQNAQSKSL